MGEIFSNRLLFSLLFSENLLGGQDLDGGDKVVIGRSPSAHLPIRQNRVIHVTNLYRHLPDCPSMIHIQLRKFHTKPRMFQMQKHCPLKLQ